MGTTSDRNDPRLTHGADDAPVPMAEVYLVLSDEERAKGFVRPYRDRYKHVGPEGPRFPVRDLTPDEAERHAGRGYVKFEEYPPDDLPKTGRFWTQLQLDAAANGACGTETRMAQSIAETYARNPQFYGATYCCGCQMHRPVGEHGEFDWLDGSKVGT